MGDLIIAYDLGTGGIKASLYDAEGHRLAETFTPYDTLYPALGWHEQRPMDWWNAVVDSTNRLMATPDVDRDRVECLAISGHSLGAVPIAKDGSLLRSATPIWSDTRANRQAAQFFEKVDECSWYMVTGNGFPPACYTVFKIMWYRDNEPEMFRRIHKIIGTKDFINLRMTGRICTDYSYASGSGVYDLRRWGYSDCLIDASGLPPSIFPEIVPSTEIIGTLTRDAAEALGLPRKVKVVCGGVDNACMAAGAGSVSPGQVYTSLGSSAWIAVISEDPVLDGDSRPYVFTHVVPEMFTSALAIFSSGSSYQWVRDNICPNLVAAAQKQGVDAYKLMDDLAADVPIGSRRLLFDPSLAGGSSLDASPAIRGAYLGIDLGHTQADLIRAAMEGVAMNLRLVLDELRRLCSVQDAMVVVGGGSKSRLWRQILSDVLNMRILKTSVGQDAGSLGAAAVAAVGCGMWKDFSVINGVHSIQDASEPVPEHVSRYEALLPVFKYAKDCQSSIADLLSQLD